MQTSEINSSSQYQHPYETLGSKQGEGKTELRDTNSITAMQGTDQENLLSSLKQWSGHLKAVGWVVAISLLVVVLFITFVLAVVAVSRANSNTGSCSSYQKSNTVAINGDIFDANTGDIFYNSSLVRLRYITSSLL